MHFKQTLDEAYQQIMYCLIGTKKVVYKINSVNLRIKVVIAVYQ